LLAEDKKMRAITPEFTLFNIYATLLFAYLYRVSGMRRLSVGTPNHNRPTEVFKNTIGLFMEIYPLQLEIAKDESFLSLLHKVREASYTFLRHAQPGASSPEGHRAYNVLLNYINTSFQDFNGLPMESEWIHPGYGDSQHSLRLLVHDLNACGSFNLLFEFHRDLVPEEQQSWAVQHFLKLLEGFLDDPAQSINRVDIVADKERQYLIIENNQTASNFPSDRTIVELFEDQIERTPEAIALVCGEQQLTYRELNAKANRLAHHLIRFGIGSEQIVGLCLPRSVEMLVGIFGILKAGAAYVPLDPDYPKERLTFILREARAPMVVTQVLYQNIFTEESAETIYLDTQWSKIAKEKMENPSTRTQPDHSAYVTYTSGSTGTPKGVIIPHSCLVNYVWWAKKSYANDEPCDFPLFSPFAFDLTITSIFVPLLSGGKIVIYDQSEDSTDDIIRKILADDAVDIIKLTPSHLSIVKHLEAQTTKLKKLIVGGEDFKCALARDVTRKFQGRIDIYNEYGPTEATVGCMLHLFNPETDLAASVHIGMPTDNVQIYVLDTCGNPLPAGVNGEIFIAGAGVARGYLHRPDITAERFVPNPFRPGSTMYRTGDLGRWHSDGYLEFLGRIDQQVKIRGARVEFGEIEAALLVNDDIHECVVDVVHYEKIEGPALKTKYRKRFAYAEDSEYIDGVEKRLVAYYVSNKLLTVSELRNCLEQQLPKYMIPSHYFRLDEIPLTPNGKVDRQRIKVQLEKRPELQEIYVPTRTPTERALAEIWSRVLRVEKVGLYDNFIELGGDSILSIQIVARANQAGLRLEPHQVFEHQTIAELAAVAGKVNRIQAEQGAVTGEVPLTPIQHWFFEQSISDRNYWNQSLIIDVLDELDPKLLKHAVQQLLMQHDALRLQFLPETSAASQKWKQSIIQTVPTIDFVVIDISTLPHTEQKQIVETTKSRLEAGHNLEKGKLIKAAYFKLGFSQPNRLFITIHHLAVDGISWSILLQDIETVYNQLVHGKSIALPAKTTSVKTWAEKLSEFAQTEVLRQELDYWTTVSKEVTSEIPIDTMVEAANTEMSTRTISASLTLEETLSLLKDVPSVYNTQINDALLTALAQTIAAWTDQNFLFISLERHGREEIIENVDLSRTSGWFTTIFPTKLTLPNSSSPSVALKSVKEQLRRIPNRGIGYGLLRYLCQDEAVMTQLATLPKPQILFNYLGQFDRALPDSKLFRFTRPLVGAHSPEALRSHLLVINMMVISGCLRMNWTFSQNVHRHQTIQQLADNNAEALRSLIAHLLSPDEAGGFTPSDFPLANLDEDKISQLANILNELE
jgi:amino acid adenylation domain-containing protein/non-ribosomal peptide synthase protein (TIGR01720 family)